MRIACLAMMVCLGCKAPGNGAPQSTIAQPLVGNAIIQASFSGTNGTSMAGLQPDLVNLPGGTYLLDTVDTSGNFSAFIDTGQGQPAPALHVYDNGSTVSGSVALSLKSNGSYVKPTTLSLQVQMMTLNPSTVLLFGFYSAPPASGTQTLSGFTGLAVDTQSGSLTLVENGTKASTISFTGSFDTGGFNTLGYSIDTTTGAISGVTLTGSTSTYDFSTSAFTDAATDYLGMGTEAGGPAGACSYYDNLVVTSSTTHSPPSPPTGVTASVR